MVANNPFSDISPIAGLTNLEGLAVWNLSIRDINFLTRLTELKHLWMSNNYISDIRPLARLRNLIGLSIGGNQITDVSPLKNLTELIELELEYNQITDVSPLKNLTKLTLLRLASNQITDVSPLKDLTALEKLFLVNNPVFTANPSSLVALETVAEDLTEKDFDIPETVYMPDAGLAAAVRNALGLAADTPIVQSQLETLPILVASSRSITDLTGLEHATGLIAMSLAGNSISDISPLQNLTNLTGLSLTDNSINDISPLQNLTNLIGLLVNENQINNISALSSLTNLEYLDVGANQVSNISSLAGLTNLTRLLLGGNSISNISPLRNLTSLTNLHVESNQVSDILPLEDLTNLTTLELQKNQITDVLPLAGLTNLKTLDLTGNTGITNAELLFRLKQRGTTITGVDVPDSVFFPDANLEDAVRSALNLQTNQPILPTPLAGLTTLNAGGRSITDLTGLEGATGLTTIDLTPNDISDVSPLSGLTQLESLGMGFNNIVDVSPLSGLTSLTYLDLRNNEITDVSPLAALENLTRLRLDNNPIRNPAVLYSLQQGGTTIEGVTAPASVDFPDAALAAALRSALRLAEDAAIPSDDLADLTRLTASNKGIVDLSGLENAASLTSLTLSNNQIADLGPLSVLTNLTTLDLRNNHIRDVWPLAGMTNLRTLTLTGNAVWNPEVLLRLKQGGTRITGVTVPDEVIFPDAALAGKVREALNVGVGEPILSDRLATFTYLDARNSGITNLTGLEQATGLTELDLGGNAISDISALSKLTNLTRLHLWRNQISDISALSKLTNLESLALWENQISNISTLSRLTNLTYLEMGGNQISDISSVSKLTTLTFLHISSNRVSDISVLSKLTNLKTLYLSHNAITDVSPLAGLMSLTRLYLTGNPISNPGALSMLQEQGTLIDIYVFSAVSIPDTALAAAVREALDLAADAPIPPDDLAALTTLDASSLGITQLTGIEAASGLTRLTLNDNQIQSVYPLRTLTRLQTLNLRDNQITDVWPLVGLRGLRTLDITNNPLENAGLLAILKQGGTRITGVTVPNAVVFKDEALEAVVRETVRSIQKNLLTQIPIEVGIPVEELPIAVPIVGIRAVDAPLLPNELTLLTTLDASSRGISDLQGIEHAMQLETLNLRNNRITDVSPLVGLTLLRRLVLDGNPVENPEGLFRLKQGGTRITGVEVPDAVFFADANLEAAVRSALRVSQHLPITAEKMRTLTRLTASRKGISDLTGLEEATGLERLDLGDNEIVDLSLLSSLMNLENLDLADNRITDVSVLSGLSNLETLDLRDNDVMDVSPLAGLTSLRQLYLRGNENLTTGLKQLVPLTGLRVDIDLPDPVAFPDTNLATAVRTQLNSFLGLNLQPSDAIFPEDVAQLTQLMATSDNISDLTGLETATGLTDLTLSFNAIVDLEPFSELTSLERLDLRNNQITDVLPLAGLTNLTRLDLTGNTGITNLGVLYKLDQQPTTMIIGVDIPEAVAFTDDALEAAVKKALKVAESDPVFPDAMATLTRLTATRKEITSLTGLEDATALERLDVGQNAITDLTPLSGLTSSLENLDVADNQITDVSALSSLSSLERLDLRNNEQITNVEPLMGLTNLRYIYLKGNEGITNLAWLGALENLRVDIKVPDVVGLPDTNLDTAVRAALSTAGQTVPATLPMSEELLESLETLDASGSGIEDLTGCEYLTELTSLDLSNNQIADVSPLSKLYSLVTLNLAGNPILDTSVLRELERRGTTIDITIYRYPSWDVNQDGDVDEADVFLITATLTGESPAPDVNGDGSVDLDDETAADADKNGTVDTADLLLVFENFDRPVNLGAPLLSAESVGLDWRLLERIDADRLRVQLNILRAENDGSLNYQQAIAFLQAVLAAIQPNQTLLLANYPNPFNPETWIPYQLARGSDVWITIYDTRGAVVRRLALGYRAEGYYRVRGRAAHWNGRNAVGERVASGIYFYQLETDDTSLLRKMVILK